MTNILVHPDLYEGSALTAVSEELEHDIKSRHLEVNTIRFKGKLKKLVTSDLDDPDVFMNHNLRVLNELKKCVQYGDKILFVDFFQLGLGLLYYYLRFVKIDVKLGALFHGASFVRNDFLKNEKWLFPFECGLMLLMDTIYVPSKFAASCIPDEFRSKVKVSAFGFDPSQFSATFDMGNKVYDVIIPQRWSWDKAPLFCERLIRSMPEVTFAISGFAGSSDDPSLRGIFNTITAQQNVRNLRISTGREHYENLSKSKVVLGTQDSFGYGVRQAMACGCIPVLANDYCYPELVPTEYLYNNLDEAVTLIRRYISGYPLGYLKPTRHSFQYILNDFYET